MEGEVFRFVTIRAPEQSQAVANPNLAFVIDGETRLVGQVRAHREPEARSKLLALVREYVGSDEFVRSLEAADARVAAFGRALRVLPPKGFGGALPRAFEAVFGSDAGGAAGTPWICSPPSARPPLSRARPNCGQSRSIALAALLCTVSACRRFCQRRRGPPTWGQWIGYDSLRDCLGAAQSHCGGNRTMAATRSRYSGFP